jgi:uncharacterized membrane protein YfcA
MTAVSMFLGGVVGLILALTGVGGAIVAVPLLLLVLHLNVAEAAPLISYHCRPHWSLMQ